MTERFVAVLMGSDSDLPVMRTTFEVFDRLGIAFEARITSAHRTPDATRTYVHDAAARGCAVFIAAAGLAAHLAGAVAAETVRPVIGVPIDAGPLNGLDALLSTVQMPAGIPVATVAIGRAGARNAAWLAAQISGHRRPEGGGEAARRACGGRRRRRGEQRRARRHVRQSVRLHRAVDLLRGGGVIAYPTEAVYGLGCDPWCATALDRVLAIKRRRLAKGFILIGARCDHLEPFVRPDWMEWVERQFARAPRPTDSPVTWLVPARAGVPAAVTGRRRARDAKVAVRITSHPVASALCRGFGGAIVSTSANAAAAPPVRRALDARLRLGSRLDLVVPGPTGGHVRPSALRDAVTGRVLRA